MKIPSVPVAARSRWSYVSLGLLLAGCGSKNGGFDAAKAPFGAMTPTMQVHSMATVTASSPLAGPPIPVVTSVVGQKTIGGASYDRLVTASVEDPSRGIEYWVKPNADKTLDFAGASITAMAGGVVPGASVTFATPIKANLDPPVGQPQTVATSGALTLTDTGASSTAAVTGQFLAQEKNVTVKTGMGPVSGCTHFSGQVKADAAGLPALFNGQTFTGEVWYHQSFGVVAFNTPALGIGTAMTDANDCGSVDSSGYKIIRKVGVVDASSSFKLDTYECDGNKFAADKTVHAKMLLELRWADEAMAKTAAQPQPVVEFGTVMGYFPHMMVPSKTSIFHPEENANGFNYWYAYVDQAAKNAPGDNTIAYHIGAKGVSGLSPVRVTARIYYKVVGEALGTPDSGVSRPSDASSTAADANCNTSLFDNWNTSACTTLASTAIFTLAASSQVATLTTWIDTRVAGASLTYSLSGPSGVVASGALDKGTCDPYQSQWCALAASISKVLPAGTYSLQVSAAAICSNSGSNGVGFVRVDGCAGGTPIGSGGAGAGGSDGGMGGAGGRSDAGVEAGKDALVATDGTGSVGGMGGAGGSSGTGGGAFTEDFDTLPTAATAFVPIQAAGGDFPKFAKVSGGSLVIDVPAGNSWGKTGVRSKEPIFQVTDDMATNPWSLQVELDPSASTGIVVVLSPTVYDDIWSYENVWASWIRHPLAGGTSASLVNTQGPSDTSKTLTNTPLTAPGLITVSARPGQAQVCTSSSWGMEGNFAWMKTGVKVYAYVFTHAYDSGMPARLAIKSIKLVRSAACGAAGSVPPYTSAPEAIVFTDDLSAGTDRYWTPIQAAGGDFTKFASAPAGEFLVDVPAGNSWGKTGLRSDYFMFDVRDDMQTTPLSLSFDLVPSRTSGFAIVLSPTVYDDIWSYENVWAAFVRHPTAGGASANIVNTQGPSDTSKSLSNIPSEAPSSVTLDVRPGHVQMCSSTGWGLEGDYAWMKTGTKVHAYVFSHAYDSGMPVQMDLTSVAANRASRCGASGAIPPYPAPAPRVLFQDAFAGGYAQNWVGIQAAGGDFAKFAKTTTGEVYVDVPAGNSWGKTGVRSNYFLFDVRSDFATAPMTLDFAFDSARTSGFAIVLSPTAYDDIWSYENAWIAFVPDPDTGEASFNMVNTQNTNDTSVSATVTPSTAPSKVSLTISTKHVKAALSTGKILEGDYAWLDVGKKVYAYVFTHPVRSGLASSMVLKSVTATR